MNLKTPCLLASLFLACSSAVAESFRIDQQNDPQPVTQKSNVAALTPIQTFRPTLTGIDFADFICNSYEAIPAQLSVRLRDGVGGLILGTTDVVTIPNDNSIEYYRFSFPSRIALTPSQTYALEVVQVGGGTGWICERFEDNYPGGTAYWDGMTPKNYDYNFREGIVIPEPATGMLIFLGSIVCLVSFARSGRTRPPAAYGIDIAASCEARWARWVLVRRQRHVACARDGGVAGGGVRGG